MALALQGLCFYDSGEPSGHASWRLDTSCPIFSGPWFALVPSGAKTTGTGTAVLNLTPLSCTSTHVQGRAALAMAACILSVHACARAPALPCVYPLMRSFHFCLHPPLPLALSPYAAIF